MNENISLEKSKQSRFTKKIKNVKKRVASGEIVVKESVGQLNKREERGVVYVGHIPHGFYEKEMRAYLSQFGRVRNLVICRSHRSGHSKGFAFVEFEDDGVARIVAETMHNYLMFNRRLTADYVPFEKRPPGLFKGKVTTNGNYILRMRRKTQNWLKNTNFDETTHLKRTQSKLAKLKCKLDKLKELGVNYGFEPVDVPEGVSKEKTTKKQDLKLEKPTKTVGVEKETKNSLKTITKKKDTIKSLPTNKRSFKLAVETILKENPAMVAKGKRTASTVVKRRLTKTEK